MSVAKKINRMIRSKICELFFSNTSCSHEDSGQTIHHIYLISNESSGNLLAASRILLSTSYCFFFRTPCMFLYYLYSMPTYIYLYILRETEKGGDIVTHLQYCLMLWIVCPCFHRGTSFYCCLYNNRYIHMQKEQDTNFFFKTDGQSEKNVCKNLLVAHQTE